MKNEINTAMKSALNADTVYLAAPFGDNRKPFKFRGAERTYSPDNYSVDEDGVASCWPFEFNFEVTEDEILGYNDNCGTAYLITEC